MTPEGQLSSAPSARRALWHQTLRDSALRLAWRRFRRLWRPMAGWTLLVWMVVVLVLLPLSSALLRWQFGRSERQIVGNEELLTWLLTPTGLAYLLFAGTLAITHSVLRYAGLFQIVIDDVNGRPASFRRVLLELAARVPTLLRFSVKAVGLIGLLLLPALAGLLALHRIFLSDHDINYYLAARPPAWTQALTGSVLWLLLWAGFVLYFLGRALLALPAWLDGHRGMLLALRQSWRLTRRRAGRLLRLFGLILAGWVLVRVAANAGFLVVMSALANATGERLWPLLLVLGAFLSGTLILNALIGFLGFSFLATVLTKVYLEDTALHRQAPDPPEHAQLVPDVSLNLLRWLHPLRSLPVLAGVLALGVTASYHSLQQLPEPGRVSITAHRAGPAPAPENTLAALERAIEAGADFAEVDTLRTRDGTPVIAHDADLMRMARDPRRISDTPYPALRDVVQLPDDGTPPSERRLATLGDFLERARGRIRLNIELKYYGWDPRLAEAVIRDIRNHGMEREVVLMSLSHEAVRQIRTLAPEIPVGYVTALSVGSVTQLDVDFIAVSRARASPDLIRAARARSLQVHAWTVNDPAVMVNLMERGVHGIITDRPALAVRVREQLAALTPAERLLLRFRTLLLPAETPPTAESRSFVQEG